MKLLDLFCGAGGCSVGYHRAGFEVTGVDIAPMPHHPYFDVIQDNALTVLADAAYVADFDVIHASPPCQAYSVTDQTCRVCPVRQACLRAGLTPQQIQAMP